MEVLTFVESMQALCKATGKWGLFLNMPELEPLDYSWEEALKAMPYLAGMEYMQALADGRCIILCDDKEECERLYETTVGDDGPTKFNDYNGPARCYALTCNPQGELLNENT